MAYKSPSTILAEWLEEIVDNEPKESILVESEVLDSKWQEITLDKGIVVSNSEWDFAPGQGGEVSFYDSLIILGFYCRIPGADTTERREARDTVGEMAQVIATKFFDDQTLGDRVCDVQVLRGVDGDKSESSDSYAIVNLPIIINPTGTMDYSLGEAR